MGEAVINPDTQKPISPAIKQLSPAVKNAGDSGLTSQIQASRDIAAAHRAPMAFPESPVAPILETVNTTAAKMVSAEPELKMAPQMPVIAQKQDTSLEVKAIANLFVKQARIETKNYHHAEKLILDFYQAAEQDFEAALRALAQELDKRTAKETGYGKVILKTKASALVFERVSPSHGRFTQEVAIEDGKLVVFTKWQEANRKLELLRARRNKVNKSSKEFKFDAEVWKSYGHGPIAAGSFHKLMDCLERNQHVLAKFVNYINHKTIFNALVPETILNPRVRSGSKASSAFNFATNAGEKLCVKLNPQLTCLQLLS